MSRYVRHLLPDGSAIAVVVDHIAAVTCIGCELTIYTIGGDDVHLTCPSTYAAARAFDTILEEIGGNA